MCNQTIISAAQRIIDHADHPHDVGAGPITISPEAFQQLADALAEKAAYDARTALLMREDARP